MLAFRKIASSYGIPESTVSFWNNKGILPETDDLTEMGKWIIGYYKGQLEEEKQKKAGKGDKNNYLSEKTRLTSAQADKVELENLIRQGELFEAAEAERAWADYVAACRSKLLAIPSRLAAELSGLSKPIEVEKRLKEAIHEALWELSRIDLEQETGESETGDRATG